MLTFGCPACQKSLQVPPQQAGTKMPCPHCGQRLLVPALPGRDRTMLCELPAAAAARAALAVMAPPVTPAPPAPPRPPREAQWYFVRKGQRQGPVPAHHLARFHSAGQVRDTDLVWTEGMSSWEPARKAAQRFAPGAPLLIEPSGALPPSLTPALLASSQARSGRHMLVLAFGALGGVFGLVAVVALAIVVARRQDEKVSEQPTPQPAAAVAAPTAQPAAVVTPPTPQPVPAAAPPAPQPVAAVAPRELTTKEIAARCMPSVPQVLGSFGGGTGIFVEGDLIFTNWHVINDTPTDQVRVNFPSGPENLRTPQLAEIVYVFPRRDLAILRFNASVPPLKLAPANSFEAGERIVVIGNPGGPDGSVLKNRVTEGVLGSQTVLEDFPWYDITAPTNPGNSGGPVLNSRAEVIGMHTLGFKQKQNMNFCVPVGDLHKALTHAKPSREDLAIRLANHDASVVFRRLAQSSMAYFRVIEQIEDQMAAAARSGGNAAGAHQTVVNQRRDDLRRADFHAESLKGLSNRLSTSPHLSAAFKKALHDYHQLNQAFQRHVYTSRVPADYGRETARLVNEFNSQTGSLLQLTNIPYVQ